MERPNKEKPKATKMVPPGPYLLLLGEPEPVSH